MLVRPKEVPSCSKSPDLGCWEHVFSTRRRGGASQKEQRAKRLWQCWEQGRGELEPAVSSGKPQGIVTSIRDDLEMKIPHVCSVYVGFDVPPTRSLVPTRVSVFQGQSYS